MLAGLFQPVGESSGDFTHTFFGPKTPWNFERFQKLSSLRFKGCNGYLKIQSLFHPNHGTLTCWTHSWRKTLCINWWRVLYIHSNNSNYSCWFGQQECGHQSDGVFQGSIELAMHAMHDQRQGLYILVMRSTHKSLSLFFVFALIYID